MNASAVSQHVAEIASDGWTIIPNAIEPALVDALRSDLERLEHALDIRPAGNSFEGAATWRIYNLLVHGSLYQQIPVHPNVLAGRRRRARHRMPRVVALVDRDRTG